MWCDVVDRSYEHCRVNSVRRRLTVEYISYLRCLFSKRSSAFWRFSSTRTARKFSDRRLSAPRPCACEKSNDEPDMLNINCQGQIQDGKIPTWVNSSQVFFEVTLADCQLASIPDLSFDGLRCRRLDLTDNFISVISPVAFRVLESSLTSLLLTLDKDTTATFPYQSLASLVNLKNLTVTICGATALPCRCAEHAGKPEKTHY